MSAPDASPVRYLIDIYFENNNYGDKAWITQIF